MVEQMLIVGGGAREHVLGWKLNNPGNQLFFARGNAGTGSLGQNLEIDSTNIEGLARYAIENHVGLTVVGPEAPLELGVVDLFQSHGLNIFGPTQSAARLETSKAFAAEFMEHHAIPSPAFHVSTTLEDAVAFIENPFWENMVIKADGLAAGKGVILPETKDEAMQAVKQMMGEHIYGKAGEIVVFQERLKGPEISVLAFSDGETVVPLLPAQDHKRIFDGDKGPNTGGMGAYAPVPFVTLEMMQTIHNQILQLTVDGMMEEGHPYKGILYAGLMMTKEGPKVLEYNARFGDPEAQPSMVLLQSDLAPILLSCIEGTLIAEQVQFRPGSATCIVLAAKGYPGKTVAGEIIHGLGKDYGPDIQIFHAGTIVNNNGDVVTNGGRVLGVTAYGKNMAEAVQRAYSVIGEDGVHFNHMQYRKDIASQAT